MSNLDQSIGRVRLVLFIFGAPFVASLGALAFRSAFADLLPFSTQMCEIVAAVSAIGLLATMLVGWIGDRRVLRRQEVELQRQEAELTLKRQELESSTRQHELELRLKEQELEKEVTIRDERARVRELEHTLKLQQLDLERLEIDRSVTPPVRPPGPPLTLNRQRKVLSEPDPATPLAAPALESDRY